jgi:cytochrome c oxidase subunit II
MRLPKTITGASAKRVCLVAGLALVGMVALGTVGWAAEPHPWQLGMQPPATPVKERIHAFHNELLIIISLITLFVLGLLAYVMVRFRAVRHPVPTRTSHNPVIEILWTVVPVLILVIIAIPSFKLMYYMDRIPNADMTIKVTGHQWYWSYEYADQGGLTVTSNLVQEKDLKPGQKRLLDVDNPLIVPVETNIRVLVTGDPEGVIHSWFVPSFGVQEYAVPGRFNESWMRVLHEGTYYGECNQICGVNHAFMPIEVKAVSKDDFQKWVGEAKKSAAANQPGEDRAVMAAAGQPRPDAPPAGN